MKELVSTAAVSFRHARAQVFLFWPFLSVFTWIRLTMNQRPSLARVDLGGALEFLMSFVELWCSIQHVRLLAVYIQAEPCSVWWFLFHLLLIHLSREVESFLFTFFVLSMPSLHLTNLVISLSLFYTPPPLKCLPLLAHGKRDLWSVVDENYRLKNKKERGTFVVQLLPHV